MKAIILAAGRGTRISRMIEAVPKSVLPVDGVPLLRYTVLLLQKKNIEVTICVGYKKEYIFEALNGLQVQYVCNPFYEVTNSIASIWFAKDLLHGELLILNGDVYFSEEILSLVLADKHDVVMLTDKTRTKEGDYFFATTDDGCIRKYGKELPLAERSSEYVGIAKLSSDFALKFKARLLYLIDRQQSNLWWENVLYSFTDHEEEMIYTLDVKGLFWSEIDYFDDYERILRYIRSKDELGKESALCT